MGLFGNLFGGSKKEAQSHHMAGGTMTSGAKTAKDPVCGMDVDIGKAAATSSYQGQTYYFCAVGCKKTFDSDPAKFLGKAGNSGKGHSCC